MLPAAAEPEDYRLLQESWKYQWQQNIYDIIIQGTLIAGGDSCFYVGTLCQAFFFEALHFILRAPLNAVTGNIPAVDLLPILILEPTDYCLCERPVFSPER